MIPYEWFTILCNSYKYPIRAIFKAIYKFPIRARYSSARFAASLRHLQSPNWQITSCSSTSWHPQVPGPWLASLATLIKKIMIADIETRLIWSSMGFNGGLKPLFPGKTYSRVYSVCYLENAQMLCGWFVFVWPRHKCGPVVLSKLLGRATSRFGKRKCRSGPTFGKRKGRSGPTFDPEKRGQRKFQ